MEEVKQKKQVEIYLFSLLNYKRTGMTLFINRRKKPGLNNIKTEPSLASSI